jgi:hypothetical protein
MYNQLRPVMTVAVMLQVSQQLTDIAIYSSNSMLLWL